MAGPPKCLFRKKGKALLHGTRNHRLCTGTKKDDKTGLIPLSSKVLVTFRRGRCFQKGISRSRGTVNAFWHDAKKTVHIVSREGTRLRATMHLKLPKSALRLLKGSRKLQMQGGCDFAMLYYFTALRPVSGLPTTECVRDSLKVCVQSHRVEKTPSRHFC